jgi:hypothetical protein
MNVIKNKIQELLTVSASDVKGDNFTSFKEKMDRQDTIMNELKTLAKNADTILGRIITFPMADSSAVYVVTKVNKTTARLDWVDYCDGWVDSRCGKSCNVNLQYVRDTIRNKDILDKLFS